MSVSNNANEAAALADKLTDMQLIARVRRAMPRNPDVMRVCDLAERGLMLASTSSPRFEDAILPELLLRQKTDRKTYMRDLMRRKRAAEKAAKEQMA